MVALFDSVLLLQVTHIDRDGENDIESCRYILLTWQTGNHHVVQHAVPCHAVPGR